MIPVHFFTIVLNGMPYIKYHLKAFERLHMPWHWHVVEGVSALVKDTAWGAYRGGYIPDRFHKDGLSVDGTTEYLNSITNPRVTIYRKPKAFWDGKVAMIREPIQNISEPCLLWQIDSDELWLPQDIGKVHKLFTGHPVKKSAYFYCFYFLGQRKYIFSDNVKSTSPEDWLRVWRFEPGMSWLRHEPPVLLDKEGMVNVGCLCPFTRAETMAEGIAFQHFAYADLMSVRFKEAYYGYKGLEEQWLWLNAMPGQTIIGEGFPGVDPGTVIANWEGRLLWES